MTDAHTICKALGGRWHGGWAALSTSGMAGLVLPRDTGELVIAPGGDDAGRKAANKLADRACAAGWHVRIMKCPDGADWNDISSETVA